MVQVIGEIGGTSSRWAVLTAGGAQTWPAKGDRWPGFNPVSGDGGGFASSIADLFGSVGPEALAASVVHLYGAGCGSDERKQRMAQAMALVWPYADIHVDSDLMGAAIGLCGNVPGMVLILGTGMNAGHFDGVRLHRPMPSLGYLLGDEASGADIGRHLLQDAFYGRIPEAVYERIFGGAHLVLSDVLSRIHQAPHPARELAAFTALLAPHLNEHYVQDLIQGRFHALAELLTRFFTAEQLEQVHATGSVAFGFRDLLADVLLDRGMTLKVVEPDPLPGLVRHHQRPMR
jgi:N-acetylglucosamine kinase-like BadF-type ATPase